MRLLFLFVIIFYFMQVNAFSQNFRYYNFEPVVTVEGIALEYIDSYDSLTIFAAGSGKPKNTSYYGSYIVKSEDGGYNWSLVYLDTSDKSTGYISPKIVDILHISKNRIIAPCDLSILVVSNDGGDTWELDTLDTYFQAHPFNFIYRGMQFVDEFRGIVELEQLGSGNDLLLITEDGGDTWENLDIPFEEFYKFSKYFTISSVSYTKDGNIFIQTGEAEWLNDTTIKDYYQYLLKTSDYGKSWEKIDLEFIRDYYSGSGIQFVDKGHGYRFVWVYSAWRKDWAGNRLKHPMILETYDGGESWSNIILDTNVVFGIKFVDFSILGKNKMLISGRIGYSPFGLIEYTLSEDRIYSLMPNDFQSLPEYFGTKGYVIVGKNKILFAGGGAYLYFVETDKPLTVERQIDDSSFLLYPNPVKGITNFSYSTNSPGSVNISIHDVLGRKVKSIFDGYKSEGSHSEYVGLTELPAGVYYIVLTAGSEMKAVKFSVGR